MAVGDGDGGVDNPIDGIGTPLVTGCGVEGTARSSFGSWSP